MNLHLADLEVFKSKISTPYSLKRRMNSWFR